MQSLFKSGEKQVAKEAKIRLYVTFPLFSGQKASLSEEQSHYLSAVMRLQNGDAVLLFNGRDGEYQATITFSGKKTAVAEIGAQQRLFTKASDVWLLFAPVKKDRTDYIIEKATELGAAKIVPVITRYTISDKPRVERFAAQATEAAEQARRLEVPEIAPAIRLEDLLRQWDEKRILYFMDESGNGIPATEAFAGSKASALLVGPEGGFAPEERDLLRHCPFAQGVSLGPLILRAETAVAAALSCWQALSGNWKGNGNE